MIRFDSRADRFRAENMVFLRLSEELRELTNQKASGFPGCLTCNPATHDLGREECHSCALNREWVQEMETKIVSLERRVWRSAGRESCPGGVSEVLDLAFDFAEDMARR